MPINVKRHLCRFKASNPLNLPAIVSHLLSSSRVNEIEKNHRLELDLNLGPQHDKQARLQLGYGTTYWLLNKPCWFNNKKSSPARTWTRDLRLYSPSLYHMCYLTIISLGEEQAKSKRIGNYYIQGVIHKLSNTNLTQKLPPLFPQKSYNDHFIFLYHVIALQWKTFSGDFIRVCFILLHKFNI